MTYVAAGVDQDLKVASAKALIKALKFKRKGLGAPVGLEMGFTGAIEFGDALLSICTDSVGTKLLVAGQLGKWDTVGIDCVAMNVNDLICIGAEPLAFVDYIATPRPEPKLWAELGKGLDEGCRQSNCTLVGGETCIIPEIVKSLDLVGTAMGWVRREAVVTGLKVAPGDAVIGMASTGVHSNGYTLVRKVVQESGHKWSEGFDGRTLGEVAITPTAIYVKAVMDLVRGVEVHGMANITGGGLRNMARWRDDMRVVIDDPMPVLPIFESIQKWGEIEDAEMWKTFNMGMGFAIAVPSKAVDDALEVLGRHHTSRVVGRVEEGKGVVQEPLGLTYADY